MTLDWGYWGWLLLAFFAEIVLSYAITSRMPDEVKPISLLGDVIAAGLLFAFGKALIMLGIIHSIKAEGLKQVGPDAPASLSTSLSTLADESARQAEQYTSFGELFITTLGMNPVLAAIVIYFGLRIVVWCIFNYERIVNVFWSAKRWLRTKWLW